MTSKSRSFVSLKSAGRIAAAVLILGCVDSSLDPNDFPATGAPTTFRLTDAPFPYDRVARVDVFVLRVMVSLASDTSAAEGGGFATAAIVNRKIDLLSLEGGLSTVLGTANLPAGVIKAVRLILDTDQSSITMKDGTVLTGTTTPGINWQSSAGTPTLNALVEDNIVVPDGGTEVVIDFDVGRTFIDPADVTPATSYQGFIFSPTLRAAQVDRTGSITGSVRLGSATGPAINEATLELKLGNPNDPENTWSTVSTTRSDANGSFKFGYVTRSAFYTHPEWTYMVVATSSAGSTAKAIVRNITVSAKANTSVGVVILPDS